MNGKYFGIGCLAVVLLAALVIAGLVFGINALVNGDKEQTVETPVAAETPVIEEIPAEDDVLPAIDASLNPWEAFALGNDAYERGDYALAEAYYRNAVQNDVYTPYYRNNLGLALLQLEQNDEALELFRALVAEAPDTYGYWVNLLVAAHANGISARAIFDEAGGWDYLPALASATMADPAGYTKVLEAIYYNAVYMDMELNPDEMYEGGFDFASVGIDPAMLQTLAAAGEYEQAFYAILVALDQINSAIYSESDPDIQELTDYLNAKSLQ